MEPMQEFAIKRLEEIGAVRLNDHFVLTSGKHSSGYINPDDFYARPDLANFLAKQLVHKPDTEVDFVAGPATGGNYLAVYVAQWFNRFNGRVPLQDDQAVKIAFTQKVKGDSPAFVFQYPELIRGKKLLIVEDVTSTGQSTIALMEEAERQGATIEGVRVLWCRSQEAHKNLIRACVVKRNISYHIFIQRDLPMYDPDHGESCPLCESGVPVNLDIGHGKKFVEQQSGVAFGKPPYALP